MMVSVAVADCRPEMDADGSTVQVGVYCAFAGLDVILQPRATAPVKPPLGAMVMVEVEEPPALNGATGVLLKAKEGAGLDGTGTACTL